MATHNQPYGSTADASFLNAYTYNIGIVVAEWNSEITDNLLNGVMTTLLDKGVKMQQIIIEYVPGSFELIYGAKSLCETFSFDAIIAIGCVIRGETSHFDYVCQSVASGLTTLNIDYESPVIFCVLTDDNIEQSRARSGGILGNKGEEAAISALRMAEMKNKYTIPEDEEDDLDFLN